jgi:hypothetical protein
MHVRVTARPFRNSHLDTVLAGTEPELNSQISTKYPNESWTKFRQLAKFRHSNLCQIPKNHLFRFGPITASHRSAQSFEWSSDAQDSEESQ